MTANFFFATIAKTRKHFGAIEIASEIAQINPSEIF